MKNNNVVLLSVLLSALTFNSLFWQQKLGINILIFDLVIIAMLFLNYPESKTKKTVIITAAGTVLTALCIMINNSLFAKITHLLSLVSLIGFVHIKSAQFVGDAFRVGLASLIETPLKIIGSFKRTEIDSVPLQPIWRWTQLSIVPVIIVSVFYMIYSFANPQFASLSSNFWQSCFDVIIPDISLGRLLFFIASFLVSGGILIRSIYYKGYISPDFPTSLKRNRILSQPRLVPFKTTGLKNEYRVALLVIFSLNALLFLVNLIDIRHVWFGSETISPQNLSNYVHEGTYLLILAILLAMGVLLYYFRKNLNFFPNNRILKTATYIWIAQNFILAISVAIRNIRYIDHFGLAYKRLGVFLFLVMVVIGLFTMFVKIKEKKTLYYLWYKNGWALYLVLMLVSVFNWDVLITRYNLSVATKSKIDVPYLMHDLSDKNIFLLLQHHEILETQFGAYSFNKMLDNKIRKFITQQENYSWPSWNVSDSRNLKSILAEEGY